MAATGSVFKRCHHDGEYRETGKAATSRRPAIPACRCNKGSWWWRVTAGTDPVTGRRRQPTQGGYPTKSAAEAALGEVRDQLHRGVFVWDQGKTVATWLREWLAQGAWEPTTRAGYASDVDAYLIPILGHVRLRDLQRPHVASMLTVLGEADDTRTQKGRRGGSTVTKRSPATVDKVRRTLRSALSAALEDGLIANNPAAGRFRQIGRRAAPSAEWWQPEELAAFFDHVARDPDVALWTVVALTGLRRSEVCGLRWEDVDLSADVPGLTVRQKCSDIPGSQPCHVCGGTHRGRQLRGGTGEGLASKSAAGAERWVPLVRTAVTELVAHQATQEARRGELGDHWSDHGLVFPADHPKDRDQPGAPRRPDSVTKRHSALVAEAGLRPIVLHEMRHGAISLLAAAGMPPDQIALIVGHSTDEVTKRIYIHGIKSSLGVHAEAAARLVRRPGDDRP